MLVEDDADGANEGILGENEGEDGVEGVADWGAGFLGRRGFSLHIKYTIIDYYPIMMYWYQ